MEPPTELLQPSQCPPAPIRTFSFPSPRTLPLPNDVIHEIFKCFSTHLSMHEWDAFPWFLGHVCSEWRYTFLSMKREFWSNIEIDWKKFERTPKFYKPVKPWENRSKALVELFLERSAGQPISFRFCLPPSRFVNFMPEDLELAATVLNPFINESHRWRDVFLQINPSAAQALLPVRNRVPLLQKLEIYVAGQNDDSLLNIFSNAPSLISVTVEDVSEWQFDWSALTTFCLQYDGRFDGFLSTLPQMTSLEKLFVNYNFKSGDRLDKKITLPSLKCLRTSGTRLLTVLEVDVLEELSISFNNDVPETIDPSLLRRSTRTVLHLRVRGIATQALIDIVQCTPHLVHLTLDCPQDFIHTLDWLARRGGERAKKHPIPHLQALSIFPHYHIVNEEQLEAICTLVASRGKRTSVNGGKSLRSLQIRYLSMFGEKNRLVLTKVKTLCEELGVTFSTVEF